MSHTIPIDIDTLPNVKDNAIARVQQKIHSLSNGPQDRESARTIKTLRSWLHAIDAAYDWLLQQESVTVDADGMMLIPSASDPATVYRTSSTLCECLAFIGDIPCWHRAAFQLVQRMCDTRDARQRHDEAVRAMMELYTL